MLKQLLPAALLAASSFTASAADGTTHASKDDSKQVRIDGNTQQTKRIKQVPPVYPTEAKKAGVQGPVVLEMAVSTDGVPQNLKVLSSPSDDLSQSAIEAVSQWRYAPTLLNGNPVEVLTEVTVTYSLTR